MLSIVKFLAVFAAGATFSWLLSRPFVTPGTPTSAIVATPARPASTSVGAIALGEVRQPGIPPAYAPPADPPANSHPRAGQPRALSRALRELERNPPQVEARPIDPETMVRTLEGVRAGLAAAQGEAP